LPHVPSHSQAREVALELKETELIRAGQIIFALRQTVANLNEQLAAKAHDASEVAAEDAGASIDARAIGGGGDSLKAARVAQLEAQLAESREELRREATALRAAKKELAAANQKMQEAQANEAPRASPRPRTSETYATPERPTGTGTSEPRRAAPIVSPETVHSMISSPYERRPRGSSAFAPAELVGRRNVTPLRERLLGAGALKVLR
jgi:hypothetical protein